MTHPYVSTVDPTILNGWSRQCQSSPSAIAIDFQSGSWTYRELDRIANHIAVSLLQNDWHPGQSVGLCVDRSPEAIAAMLGVMKAGGVFVPLDPEYPVDRLSYMVSDAGVQKILGHDTYYPTIGAHLVRDAVWVDVQSFVDPADPTDLNFPLIQPDALAYIMYTSGSTGRPKGVEISHSALATYCDADLDVYQLTPADRTLQFSTLCFDIAIEEIFPPLLSGGCVVIRPAERSCEHNELSAIVRRFDVTAIHLATAYWHQWVDLMVASGAKVPTSLRLVIATGEKVSVEHYRRWQFICDHDVLWCNAYGPTETTVTATVFIPDRDFDEPHMPIGKPLKHYTAFILDPDRQPVKQNDTGDLYLGGPALATGYHHREDLNEIAFIHTMIDGQSHRLYRTGDLARWLPDGNLEFAGRIDHQIKLGSYRIEPGEIDAVLNQAPGVRESLVTYEQIGNQKFLIAYVATDTADGRRFRVNDLCAFARQSLPPYMVPTRYVLLTEMPKTINGKIDRDRLPDPSHAITARAGDYVSPRTELEQQLVAVWQEVLGVPEIGVHDDFFLLGGSSLLVTQVVARLTRKLNIELPVRDFFAHPTAATLAGHLAVLTGRTSSQPSQADWTAIRDRLPIVKSQFLGTSTGRLYLSEYCCRNGTSESAVLICHALGHEYMRGYRNVQQLAMMLSAAGHHVLRFDYYGSGNSEGGCEELSADTMLRNAIEMKQYLHSVTDAKTLDVIGIRTGAWVAAELSTAETSVAKIDRAVYWDPVIDGCEMLKQFDRFHHQQFKGLTRFSTRRRDITIDQTYGHAMPLTKRTSLGSMKLRDTSRNEWTVATAGSLRSPTESQWRLRQPNLIDVPDAICWDDVAFTESAFSSPESYRTIAHLLHRPICESY